MQMPDENTIQWVEANIFPSSQQMFGWQAGSSFGPGNCCTSVLLCSRTIRPCGLTTSTGHFETGLGNRTSWNLTSGGTVSRSSRNHLLKVESPTPFCVANSDWVRGNAPTSVAAAYESTAAVQNQFWCIHPAMISRSVAGNQTWIVSRIRTSYGFPNAFPVRGAYQFLLGLP